MHPKLIAYTQRFQSPKSSNSQPPAFDKFFTDFTPEEHFEKLPFLFDIENFVIRALLAKLKSQKICIYADYDTDAVTATGVVYHGLLDLGFDSSLIDFYTPDRFTEGYGINGEAVARLVTIFDLIISVDCGINSVDEAQIIQDSENCDLLITDHHHLHNKVPDCIGVVNPRLGEYYGSFYNAKIKKKSKDKTKSEQDFLAKEEDAPKSSKPPVTNPKILKELNTLLDKNTQIKLQEYLTKIQKIKEMPNYNNYLSSSVTGVGVAWFCLVWLGYAMDYLKIE